MPVWNEGPVATTRSPVVRYLHWGERVRSYIVAVGRSSWPHYGKCGGQSLWRVVSVGQVLSGCLRRAWADQRIRCTAPTPLYYVLTTLLRPDDLKVLTPAEVVDCPAHVLRQRDGTHHLVSSRDAHAFDDASG
ncbi:hypothetical protein FNH09_08205 [Streptomyces adustus]|uniref:Uncharacterized protein n=1 Tax=Streptomyces adustus TaxID=1609272 RepID=A0A5N8V7U7_9ACTN|nr:hypothetical protein [Streptomyces adustus]MPY31283.1 hypothetical protein [Streptomyces adustus]